MAQRQRTSLLISHSTLRNHRASPLLRLPGELQNTIYEHVLESHRISPRRKPQHCASLLFVCRQIYTDTALLPYRQFTFCFDAIHRGKRKWTLEDFARRRSKDQIQAIRRLKLVTIDLWETRMWDENCMVEDCLPLVLDSFPQLEILKMLAVYRGEVRESMEVRFKKLHANMEKLVQRIRPGLVVQAEWVDSIEALWISGR